MDLPADLSLVAVPGNVPRHRSSPRAGAVSAPPTSSSSTTPASRFPQVARVSSGSEDPDHARLQQARTVEVFDADGWFHTGDRVFVLDDEPGIFYVGRSTELIKTSGANVSPKEVESVSTGTRRCNRAWWWESVTVTATGSGRGRGAGRSRNVRRRPGERRHPP